LEGSFRRLTFDGKLLLDVLEVVGILGADGAGGSLNRHSGDNVLGICWWWLIGTRESQDQIWALCWRGLLRCAILKMTHAAERLDFCGISSGKARDRKTGCLEVEAFTHLFYVHTKYTSKEHSDVTVYIMTSFTGRQDLAVEHVEASASSRPRPTPSSDASSAQHTCFDFAFSLTNSDTACST
jgi:hypothetical protein